MTIALICLVEVPANAAPGERFEMRLRAGGSDLFGFSTTDERFYAVFGEGACRPRPTQTAVQIEVQPLDPTTLGALPAGLLPTGQAYQLRARYLPSGQPIKAFAAEVTVGLVYRRTELTSPDARTLLYSNDAKRWTRIQTSDVPDPGSSDRPATSPWLRAGGGSQRRSRIGRDGR